MNPLTPSLSTIVHEVKELILSVTNLQAMSVEKISDDVILFGTGLGLDSIDMLEIVVNVEKKYGLKIRNDEQGRVTLSTVRGLATAIHSNLLSAKVTAK